MRATQGGPSVACVGGSSQLHPFMDGDGDVDEDVECYRRQAEQARRRDEEATEQIERLSEDMEQAGRKHLDFVQERETQLYQTRKEMRDAIGLMEGAMKEHLKTVEEKSRKTEQEINHITQRRIDHLESVLKSAGLKAKVALDQKAREKELRVQAEILLEQRTHRINEQAVQLSERNLRIQDLTQEIQALKASSSTASVDQQQQTRGISQSAGSASLSEPSGFQRFLEEHRDARLQRRENAIPVEHLKAAAQHFEPLIQLIAVEHLPVVRGVSRGSSVTQEYAEMLLAEFNGLREEIQRHTINVCDLYRGYLESKLSPSKRPPFAGRELNGVDPLMDRHPEDAQRQAGSSNEHLTGDQDVPRLMGSHARESAPPPPSPVHAMDVDGPIRTGADAHQDGQGRPDGGEEGPELPDATSRETRPASTPLSPSSQPMERPAAQDQKQGQHRRGHEDQAGAMPKGGNKRKRAEDGEQEFVGEDTECRRELDGGQQHPAPQGDSRGRWSFTRGVAGTASARLLSQDTELTLTLSSAGTSHAGGRQLDDTSTSASGASGWPQSEGLGNIAGRRREGLNEAEKQDEGTEEHKEHRRSGLQDSLGASYTIGASAGPDHAVDGGRRSLRKQHSVKMPPLPPGDKVPRPRPAKQPKSSTGKDRKKSAQQPEDLPWSELPDWFVAFCQWIGRGKSFEQVIPKRRREALRATGGYKGRTAAQKPKEGSLGSSTWVKGYAKIAYDLLTDIAGDKRLPQTETAARELLMAGEARVAKILGPRAYFDKELHATVDAEDTEWEVWAPWYLWQFLIGPEALVPGARVSASTKTKNPDGKSAASRPTSQQQHDAEAPRPQRPEFPASKSVGMIWLTPECKVGLWEHLLEQQIAEGTRNSYWSEIGKMLERVLEALGRDVNSTMSAISLFDALLKHKSVVKEVLRSAGDKISSWNHLVKYLNGAIGPGRAQLDTLSRKPKDGASASSDFDFSERDEGQAVQPSSSQSHAKNATAVATEPSTAGLRRSGRCHPQLHTPRPEPEPEGGDGPMHPMEVERSPVIEDDDARYASMHERASGEDRSIEVAALPHDTIMQEMDRMEVEDSTLAPAGSQVVSEPAASTATSTTGTGTLETSASALPPLVAPLSTSEPASTGDGLPAQSGDQQDDDEPPGLDISETQQHPPPEQPQPQQQPASEQQQPVAKQLQLDTSAEAGGSRHSSASITPEDTPGFFSQHAPTEVENILVPLNPHPLETVSADDHVQRGEDDEDAFDAEEADGEGPFAELIIGICGSVPQGSTERINPLFDNHDTPDVDPHPGGREKGVDGERDPASVNHEDW